MSRTPENPIVCYVTDRNALGLVDPLAGLRERIRMVMEAGADWVQVRERDLSADKLLSVVRGAVSAASPFARAMSSGEARVIVNDRLDVALAAGAAGVHLGAQSVPAREIVCWCRSGNALAAFLVGLSCHTLDEALEAQGAGVDYLIFGPVFDTPSKRAFGPAQGIARLAEVCRATRIPVIAIGGIDAENGADCVRAGAAGIAAIRMFQEARSVDALRASIRNLRRLK